MGTKRILWLLNHTTLRDFEVPMLIDMGYEVYCPNFFPYDEGNLSASVERKYDETLTIPKDILKRLNQVNFYENVSMEIKDILNQYFDLVFHAFFPEQMYYLLNSFRGVIIFQPFGLGGGVTYTKVLKDSLGVKIFHLLSENTNRFFFGQSYENLAEIECDLLKNNMVNMPIGLKNAAVNHTWSGGDHKILFICPRINSSLYFKKVYEDFKKNFNGFDYLIGGAQPIEVKNDKRVLGFIPQEQYEYNMTKLDVMFYHSQEPRHLHYHPLEAVKNGMPLIFMAGGMLDQLGGKALSGRCSTIKEAQNKIKRIINGDRNFIQQVVSSQEVLLTPFSYHFCREKWNIAMEKVEQALASLPHNPMKRKKIAVILPAEYTGGVLDYTLRFLKAMHRGLQEDGQPADLVFGYKRHENFLKKDYFEEIKDLGISIRDFEWKIETNRFVNNYLQLSNIEFDQEQHESTLGEAFCFMNDGVNYFADCDFIIFTVDRLPATYMATKPYIVLAHDYIQRYLPSLYGEYYEKSVLELHRKADCVFVTTEPTFRDAINYGGLPRNSVTLTPLLFERVELPKFAPPQPRKWNEYFVWSTNTASHKNHKMALQAISDYYAKGGKLMCYMTGTNTEKFDYTRKDETQSEDGYAEEIRNIIKSDDYLKKNIVFCGNMDKAKYLYTLSRAKFLLHPGYADNGNGTAIDAAFLGVPTLSSDYPAMRYIDQYIGLGMRFFDPFKATQLTAQLLKTEQDHETLRATIPPVETLEHFTIDATYQELYNKVKAVICF